MIFFLTRREGIESHGEHQRQRRHPFRYPQKATGCRILLKIQMFRSTVSITRNLEINIIYNHNLYTEYRYLLTIWSIQRLDDCLRPSSPTNSIDVSSKVIINGFDPTNLFKIIHSTSKHQLPSTTISIQPLYVHQEPFQRFQSLLLHYDGLDDLMTVFVHHHPTNPFPTRPYPLQISS